MNDIKRRILLNALRIFDLGVAILSYGLATLLVASQTASIPLSEFLSMRVKLWNFAIFAVIVVGWHLIFVACGLYESKRLATRWSEVVDVVKATTLAAAALLFAAKVLKIQLCTSEFLILFWLSSSVLFVVGRLVLRYLLAMIRKHGRNLRFILILGTNRRAIEFAKKIGAEPELGYRIVGFADDRWEGTKEFIRTGLRTCCTLDSFADYLRNSIVDEVAFYLPLRSFYQHASEFAALCEQHGTIVRFDSDIFNLKISRPRTEILQGKPQIAVFSGPLGGWSVIAKRIFDFVASLVLLILLTPLLGVVALLIKATTRGPVLFRQDRVGLNKRTFVMYKFRSMVRDADKRIAEVEHLNEASGPVFKIRNDPRLTSIGKMLRRTSVDELPQLFNVLKGDMSLVGPRPLPVRDYEGFSEDSQRRRFIVRPGITCLWQVNGRSSITFERWMELDMQYIDAWSLWLDLKILAWTIPSVLKGSGAV